ncbi:MAG: CaiB/BaiF CoA transferase family protein [Marinobacter sp.]
MKAFEGLKVVDFTQVVSGPMATQMLSLLGADVIKIETPGKGDEMRLLLTDPEMAARFLAPSFLTNNMGKRSLALNLKSDQGRAVVAKMMDEADVIIENFRPGVAKRLGIDYATVKPRNPNVIYCSVSGYGQEGPKSTDGAYDTSIQADAGLMALTGYPETGPTRAGFLAVDTFTGMSAAFAISSALYRREKTGAGQFLDVAMYDSALVLGGSQMADFMVRGNVAPRCGNRSPTGQPTNGGFKTADGMILLVALTRVQQEKAFKVLQMESLLDDPLYATPEARYQNGDSARVLIAERLLTHSSDEWMRLFKEVSVPVQKVRTLAEAVGDPQLAHRGVKVLAEGITGLEHPVNLIGAPFIANEDGPMTKAKPPGKVGEHTAEVLAELGYSPADIKQILAGTN